MLVYALGHGEACKARREAVTQWGRQLAWQWGPPSRGLCVRSRAGGKPPP